MLTLDMNAEHEPQKKYRTDVFIKYEEETQIKNSSFLLLFL